MQILDDKTLYIPGLHLRTGGDRGYRFQASTRDSPDKFSVDIPNENNRCGDSLHVIVGEADLYILMLYVHYTTILRRPAVCQLIPYILDVL